MGVGEDAFDAVARQSFGRGVDLEGKLFGAGGRRREAEGGEERERSDSPALHDASV